MATDIQIENPRRVRMLDLMRLPEFATLSEKQQCFVSAYVSSGYLNGRYDATAAAAVAYKTVNPQVLGANLIGQKKIRQVLDVHFGRSALDAILVDLAKAVRKAVRRGSKGRVSITPEFAQALELFEQYIAAKGNTLNTDVPRS